MLFHSLKDPGSFLPQFLPSARKTALIPTPSPLPSCRFQSRSRPGASPLTPSTLSLPCAPSRSFLQFLILHTCVLGSSVPSLLVQAENLLSVVVTAGPVLSVRWVVNEFHLHHNTRTFRFLTCDATAVVLAFSVLRLLDRPHKTAR